MHPIGLVSRSFFEKNFLGKNDTEKERNSQRERERGERGGGGQGAEKKSHIFLIKQFNFFI